MIQSLRIRFRSVWHESALGQIWRAHRSGDVFHLVQGNDWLQRTLHEIRVSPAYFRYLESKQRRDESAYYSHPEGATPPYTVKRDQLRQLAVRHGCSLLVETGTYFGDTPYALRGVFREIHTVEVSPYLHQLGKRRFRRFSHIHPWRGDSVDVLPKILAQISEPTLFWLDGHCSGGVSSQGKSYSPILEELRLILDHPVQGHVLAIDDARLFVGSGGYPSIDEVTCLIGQSVPEYTVRLSMDAILVEPVH